MATINRDITISTLCFTFLGTVLEWYDFSVFAFLAPVISALFFPSQNKLAAYLSIYAVFAIGFFIRPLGALFFGHYGDRLGRKKMLLFSMVTISMATFCMGLLPTYAQIGIMAPILLVVLRLLQGFCVGGETTGAVAFILESYPTKKRGMIGSLMWSAVGVGMLLGSFTTLLVVKLFSHAFLYSVGWRIPFLVGILTGIVGYYFRRKMPETRLFSAARNQGQLVKSPLREVFANSRKSIMTIAGLYALSATITYLLFIFMSAYASSIIGISLAQAQLITTLAIGCVTLLMPVSGLLSDVIGRKPCLYIGAIGLLLFSYPLFSLMVNCHSLSSFIFAEICFVLLATFYQGALTAASQEATQTYIRYTVTAIGYNFSYSLFGGLAPLVATYTTTLGNKAMPGVYLALVAFIAIIAILNIKETSKSVLL